MCDDTTGGRHRIFGYVGATLIAISLAPQVYKSCTTQSTSDISMLWLCIECLATCFMMTYGIINSEHVIVIANGMIFSMHALLIVTKLSYGRRRKRAHTPQTLPTASSSTPAAVVGRKDNDNDDVPAFVAEA